MTDGQIKTIPIKDYLKNRGIHKAMKLMDKYMKDEAGTMYCLKIDVNKFYPSINHEILKNLLRKKFKDKDLLELLDKIIDSIPDGKGVPIGSYLSQYLANFYLAYFDSVPAYAGVILVDILPAAVAHECSRVCGGDPI